MAFVAITIFVLVVVGACGELPPQGLHVQPINTVEVAANGLANTELVLAFVVFRHGDRTPDLDELELYKSEKDYKEIFFPYGPKALTNKGKQRSFKVGEYLRWRYDGFLSRLYLPDELKVRTTDFARTKMTALSALAALYPPDDTAQRWNPDLNWQPVPYYALPFEQDDLLYYYNCPRYDFLRHNVIYKLPEVKELLKPYENLFTYLSEHTGTNITTPEDVFYLDNLFQTLGNVGVETPKFALEVMPEIKEMTKIEYNLEYYNSEMIRLATGVTMNEIIHAMSVAVNSSDGDHDLPKLTLVSAHENNVAAWMAAARVFYPHQPLYGATFALELRKIPSTGQHGVTASYSPVAGAPPRTLIIDFCEDIFCDFDTFRNFTQTVTFTYDEYKEQCARTSE